MADQDLNNNSAPDLGGDDTRTRKTVRLAPSVFSTQTEAEYICKVFIKIGEKALH